MTKAPLCLATLCVQGTPATSTKDNADRLILLSQTVRTLRQHPKWHSLHALVLPGGTFRLSRALGATTFERRREILQNEKITAPIIASLESLDMLSPSLTLVTGALATPRDISERTEQLCLAFTRSGLVGAARKIFPTKQENQRRQYVSPFVDDYQKKGRLVALPLGHLAILAACYDLYGIADIGSATNSRRHAIRRMIQGRRKLLMGDEGFNSVREDALASLAKWVTEVKPDAALATVHGLMPGRDGYWTRHGISRASAALGGKLVVAAAHFKGALPSPEKSTLAAYGVPRSHLTDGASRRAHSLPPIYSTIVESPTGLRGLLRVFRVPRPNKKMDRP